MLIAWNTDLAPVDAVRAPQGSFREQLITSVYDQVASASAVGRQRGHSFGYGHFTMTVELHHIGGVSAKSSARAAALNRWLARMNALGAYSDIPIVRSLYPTHSGSDAVVSSSMLDGAGQRVTTISANRSDITANMYLQSNNRLFVVMDKPAANQIVLFPSLALSNGDMLAPATTFRGRLTEDNPGAVAYHKDTIEYPRLNFTEVL